MDFTNTTPSSLIKTFSIQHRNLLILGTVYKYKVGDAAILCAIVWNMKSF